MKEKNFRVEEMEARLEMASWLPDGVCDNTNPAPAEPAPDPGTGGGSGGTT